VPTGKHVCERARPVFQLGGQKYIPAESVYAAFDVKQELTKGDIEYAAQKGASVRRLNRTNIAFQHAGGIQQPRPLFPILTGVLTTESSWTPPFGDSFSNAIQNTAGDETQLDIGCALRHGAFDIDWTGDNDPRIIFSEAGTSLMFFPAASFRPPPSARNRPRDRPWSLRTIDGGSTYSLAKQLFSYSSLRERTGGSRRVDRCAAATAKR
jgi:hypothetical protein